MTVAELIKLLEQEDPEAIVVATDERGDKYETTELQRGFAEGDSGYVRWATTQKSLAAKRAVEIV